MRTLALTCATGALLCAGAALAQETVSFASYGGAYQEALRKALLDPIEKEQGMKVVEYTLAQGINDIRTRVKGGANDLDVAELYGGQCQQAADEGLLVALDYSMIPNASGIPEQLRAEHFIGFTAYSTVMAWNKEVYKDAAPQNWADFFDTEKFPGTRAMSGYGPNTNLEIALLADGADRNALYPLDEARGFAKLETLKDDVAVWWSSGSQATQLAINQEVDMLTIWAARIDAAIKEGAPFDYTYVDGIMDIECLVIPKDSPNPAGAMRLVNHLLNAEYQANLPALIPYGPMNQDAFKLGKITPEQAARVITSTENLPKHVLLNQAYWAQNGQRLQETWDKFKN
jgi:putative spermidine/putrescine transport system substrate-binding protein